MTAIAVEHQVRESRVVPRRVPMSRVTAVEMRKMFDTRSGFWLMASIVIAAISATGAVILPMVAILSVTSEWSQRSGLTSFTLVPHRGRVIMAKAVSAVLVAVVSIPLALGVGAVGNLVASAIHGTDLVWDISLLHATEIVLGNVLGLMVGFTLGVLIRNSAGAVVGYFVYALLLPTLSGLLAANQDWFHSLQPWVDFNFAQGQLFGGDMGATQWAHLGTAGALWLVLPLLVGLRLVMRTEVK